MGSVDVAACLKEYSDDRMKDEAAYAFMARLKTPAERLAVKLGGALGMAAGRAGKDGPAALRRYSELSTVQNSLSQLKVAAGGGMAAIVAVLVAVVRRVVFARLFGAK